MEPVGWTLGSFVLRNTESVFDMKFRLARELGANTAGIVEVLSFVFSNCLI